MTTQELREISFRLREKVIRSSTLVPHHIGGCLSCIELMVFVFYELGCVRRFPQNHFILSKGHAAITYYHILEDLGLVLQSDIERMAGPENILLGHPCSTNVAAISCSTGSLGIGLSFGAGLAYGYKMQMTDEIVYILASDGELQSGITWEALMFIAHHKLRNCIIFIDANGLQTDAKTSEIIDVSATPRMLEALGFCVSEIDGHDFDQLRYAVGRRPLGEARPIAIFAKTTKGKGVGFMENVVDWHSGILDEQTAKLALTDLRRSYGGAQ